MLFDIFIILIVLNIVNIVLSIVRKKIIFKNANIISFHILIYNIFFHDCLLFYFILIARLEMHY